MEEEEVQEAADGIFRGLCAWFSPDTSDHHREYWRKGGGREEEEPLEDHALNPRLHFLFSDLYSPRVQRISESFPNVTVLTTEWIKQSVTEGKLINAGRYVLADPQLLSYIEENKLTDKDTNIPQTAKRKISEENAAPNEKRPKRIAKRTKGKKPKEKKSQRQSPSKHRSQKRKNQNERRENRESAEQNRQRSSKALRRRMRHCRTERERSRGSHRSNINNKNNPCSARRHKSGSRTEIAFGSGTGASKAKPKRQESDRSEIWKPKREPLGFVFLFFPTTIANNGVLCFKRTWSTGCVCRDRWARQVGSARSPATPSE